MKKLAFLLFLIPACHFPWQKAQMQVIDCANESLKKLFVDLVPQVLAILTGASPDWNATLESMARQYGDPAMMCAATAVWNDLTGQKAALNPSAISRTKQYLDSKKPLQAKF